MLRRLTPLVLVMVAIAVFFTALQTFVQQESTDTTTTTPQATPTTVASPPVGDAFLWEQVSRVSIPEGRGAFLLAVVDANGSVDHASQGSDPAGAPLTPDAVFRIGSVTKVFTAALTLALLDDGEVDLDSPVADYVTRVSVPDDVTVRDLLQHTSGIPDYTDSPLTLESRAFDDPRRVWLPEETIGLVENQELLFEPGATFSHSNTNYSILGVLIEEVTGLPFAAALRDRILEPLGLDDTYLGGFEQGQDPFSAYTIFGPTNAPGTTAEPINFDYTAIATDAWAAGAMVSSVEDLHAFFSALFEGQVISAESLAAMISGEEYGLGIAPLSFLGIEDPSIAGGYLAPRIEDLSGFGDVFGHGGGVPGYRTLALHSPGTGKTAVWVASNEAIRFDGTIAAVAGYIRRG